MEVFFLYLLCSSNPVTTTLGVVNQIEVAREARSYSIVVKGLPISQTMLAEWQITFNFNDGSRTRFTQTGSLTWQVGQNAVRRVSNCGTRIETK